MRAEQADTLRAGDLGVQIKFAGDTADGHQAFRRDFAARRARDNGVGTVFLDVGQEVVVGILQRGMLRLEDIFVPAGSQQRATVGLHFAAVAFSVFRQQLFKRFDAFHRMRWNSSLMEYAKCSHRLLLTSDTLFRQFGVEHLSHQRDTAAAAGTGFGFRLQRRHPCGSLY